MKELEDLKAEFWNEERNFQRNEFWNGALLKERNEERNEERIVV